jgi:hypothetical protein
MSDIFVIQLGDAYIQGDRQTDINRHKAHTHTHTLASYVSHYRGHRTSLSSKMENEEDLYIVHDNRTTINKHSQIVKKHAPLPHIWLCGVYSDDFNLTFPQST